MQAGNRRTLGEYRGNIFFFANTNGEAKKVLIPITSAADFGMVPADILNAVQPLFYSTAEEAVFRALGVD
ncbi:MAG: hypothetical protein BHW11_04470 [Clostridium sp. CAG:62_40_43]|nr:MAG: hypothetical protein BHW11_04470 [Clostridium sp. CAG:62_40_43]